MDKITRQDSAGGLVMGEAETAEQFADITVRVARALGFTNEDIAALFVRPDSYADAAFEIEQATRSGIVKFSARAVKAHMAALVAAPVGAH